MIPMNPAVSTVELLGDEIVAMLEENLERTFGRDPYDQMGGYVKRGLGLNAFIKIENPSGQRVQEVFSTALPQNRGAPGGHGPASILGASLVASPLLRDDEWESGDAERRQASGTVFAAGNQEMNNMIHRSLAILSSAGLLAVATACGQSSGTVEKKTESTTRSSEGTVKTTNETNGRRGAADGGMVMKGFVRDIEALAIKNEDFRQVLYTAKNCQLVVMALKPKEEIGAEVHKLDQFFRVEEGTGEAVLDGVRTAIQAGFAVLVPAGTKHNIINTSDSPLKLYTLYAPPNHRDGVVHHTRSEAEADNEHFDGKTTE